CARRLPVVWDPHPRGPEPVPGLALVTPNRAEVMAFAGRLDRSGRLESSELAAIAARAAALRGRWRADGLAVTMGPEGALLLTGGGLPAAFPAPARTHGDPCGAGDQFACRAVEVLAAGGSLQDAVRGAVEAASGF